MAWYFYLLPNSAWIYWLFPIPFSGQPYLEEELFRTVPEGLNRKINARYSPDEARLLRKVCLTYCRQNPQETDNYKVYALFNRMFRKT